MTSKMEILKLQRWKRDVRVKKKVKKTQQELSDSIRQSNTGIMGVPEGGEEKDKEMAYLNE